MCGRVHLRTDISPLRSASNVTTTSDVRRQEAGVEPSRSTRSHSVPPRRDPAPLEGGQVPQTRRGGSRRGSAARVSRMTHGATSNTSKMSLLTTEDQRASDGALTHFISHCGGESARTRCVTDSGAAANWQNGTMAQWQTGLWLALFREGERCWRGQRARGLCVQCWSGAELDTH